MRKAQSLWSILICVAVSAQNATPTIKGHRIGEGIMDYLVVAHGGTDGAKASLLDCGAFLSDPKNQKRYGKGPNYSKTDEIQFSGRVEGCMKVSDALSGKTSLIVDGLEKYLFEERKLVVIKLERVDAFDKVVRDVSEKFGMPDMIEDVKYQNGFGAVFVHPRATWNKRSDVLIVVSESEKLFPIPVNDKPFYTVSALVEDRAYANKESDKEQNKPNSLD